MLTCSPSPPTYPSSYRFLQLPCSLLRHGLLLYSIAVCFAPQFLEFCIAVSPRLKPLNWRRRRFEPLLPSCSSDRVQIIWRRLLLFPPVSAGVLPSFKFLRCRHRLGDPTTTSDMRGARFGTRPAVENGGSSTGQQLPPYPRRQLFILGM